MPKQPPPTPTPTAEPAALTADDVKRREEIAAGIIADGLITLLLRERFERLDREDQEQRLAEEEAKKSAQEGEHRRLYGRRGARRR